MAYSVATNFTAQDGTSSVISQIINRTRQWYNTSRTAFRNMNNGARRLNDHLSGVNNAVNRIGRGMTGFGGQLGLTVGVAGLGLALGNVVKEAMKVEDAVARFTPILGGAEKATELVKKLNETAATTPHTFDEISKVAGQLLPNMNNDLDKTVATFRMLGDVSGGNMQRLESVTRGYNKALLKGKPDMESLNMISEAGVPILAQLAKKYGKTTAEIIKMSSKSQLTNKMLEDTFKSMTTKGGMFFKGMEIASKTTSGMLSTMKDNISAVAAELGAVLLPFIKEYIDKLLIILPQMKAWVVANKDLIKTNLEGFIKGVINAVKFLYDNWHNIVLVFKVVLPMLAALKIAMIAVNIAMAANPVGAIITGVSLLVIGIMFLIENWNAWGDTVRAYLPLLGILIDFFKAIYDGWKLISNAFKDGGFINVLKAVGLALLNLVLSPIQSILSVIAELTGSDMVKGWADDLKDFRAGLVEVDVSNPEAERSVSEKKTSDSYFSKQEKNVTVDFKNMPVGASVSQDTDGGNVSTNNTLSWL